MQAGDDSPFRRLFADLGIEGSGDPPPEPKKATPQVRTVVLGFERRSGNKSVTTVRDVPTELRADLLQQIKKSLGTGGTVDGDFLVLQGDRRKDLTRWFETRSIKVRGERG